MTPSDVPDIVLRFAGHARSQPQALALFFADEPVSYEELDRWSSAVGRDLAAVGTMPGDGVAVLARRNTALVAGMLGVMRAGAWWVVIDPEQDKRHQEMLIERCRCVAALTMEDAGAAVPACRTVLSLDRRYAEPWQVQPHHALPAYACFTSGTTASPKAVLVSRGSLSCFAHGFIERVGIRPQSSMAGFCAPDWDGFVIDVWLPLAAGAAAESGAAAHRNNPDAIARFIADRQVEMAFLPTAIGQLVMESRHLASARKLRHLCLGGDRMTKRPPPGAGYTLWNMYGPTEATVAALASPVTAEGPANIPLGWPLPGATVEIVDSALRPVAPGGPGEILIGGTGVAIGYAGQPRVTAAAFVPGPAGRRYRTGDMGQLMPDGQFAFLGRRDRQVSIHGRRVELDGVRAALRKVAGVADAAVTVAGAGKAQTLIAFVAREGGNGTGLSAESLQAGLSSWLSSQQMPDRIVFVPEIPACDGAELDDDTLAALLDGAEPGTGPASDQEDAGAEHLPTDEIDECVADAWAQLLGGARPRMDEDFFAAGGDSLLAVQLAQHLQAAFDVELPLIPFLGSPTPRCLAGLLRAELERQFDALSEEERARLLRDYP
jgi:amino acid adenylation domain-containing protein